MTGRGGPPAARWRVLGRRVAFRCPWYQIRDERVRLPTGQAIHYYYVHISDSVLVVPVLDGGRAVLIRQYRYPAHTFTYELPGGSTGGRSPLQAGRRELLEETGYRARHWRRLGRFNPYPGMTDETCHVYLATELVPGRQDLDEREFIEVVEVPTKQLVEWARRGRIESGMTLAALTLARPYLEKGTGP